MSGYVCTYRVDIYIEGDDYRAVIKEATRSGKRLPAHLAAETLLEVADACQRTAEKHYPELVEEWRA